MTQIIVDISSEIIEARRNQNSILKLLKGKNYQPKIPCPAKYSKNAGEIKNLLRTKKVEFVASIPALYKSTFFKQMAMIPDENLDYQE